MVNTVDVMIPLPRKSSQHQPKSRENANGLFKDFSQKQVLWSYEWFFQRLDLSPSNSPLGPRITIALSSLEDQTFRGETLILFKKHRVCEGYESCLQVKGVLE